MSINGHEDQAEHLVRLMVNIKQHQQDMNNVVNSLQAAVRGSVGISQFRDLKAALKNMASVRKDMETAKRLVKSWLADELKE